MPNITPNARTPGSSTPAASTPAALTPEALTPKALTPEALAFVAERHLAFLSTVSADGTPHQVPVGFTYDTVTGLLRVITAGSSQKVANIRRNPLVSIGQVDGARWISFAGPATVSTDPERVRDAETRYAVRYRMPRPNPQRVVIELRPEALLGSSGMRQPAAL